MGKSRDPALSVSCRLPTLQEEEPLEARLLRCVLALQCIARHCLRVQSTRCTQEELEEVCKAGASFTLPGPKSSKLGQMQERKLKVSAWDLSLSLSITVLAEKQVGRKIRI